MWGSQQSGRLVHRLEVARPIASRRPGNTLTVVHVTEPEAFIQDDWLVNNKLNVNIGLVWEFTNPPYDTTDRIGNLFVTRD